MVGPRTRFDIRPAVGPTWPTRWVVVARDDDYALAFATTRWGARRAALRLHRAEARKARRRLRRGRQPV